MVDYQTKQKRNNKLMYDVAQAAEQMPSFRSQRFDSLVIIFSILLSIIAREGDSSESWVLGKHDDGYEGVVVVGGVGGALRRAYEGEDHLTAVTTTAATIAATDTDCDRSVPSIPVSTRTQTGKKSAEPHLRTEELLFATTMSMRLPAASEITIAIVSSE